MSEELYADEHDRMTPDDWHEIESACGDGEAHAENWECRCDAIATLVIQQRIRARAEERERCAGIAEKRFTCECTDRFCRGTVNAAKIIAAAIRAGEERGA